MELCVFGASASVGALFVLEESMKKLLISLLVLATIVTVAMIGATSVGATTSGTYGDCIWTLDGTILTISGNGKMDDYGGSKPWDTSKITEVIIEEGVTHIGDFAFHRRLNLESITIPNSVKTIGFCAFYECIILENIIIPKNVTSISAYAFYYCRSLTDITIPDNVTTIENNTFEECISLTSIDIPDKVTHIGTEAFLHCESLASITIPDSVTSIGTDAFYWCLNLDNVYINSAVIAKKLVKKDDCGRLVSLTDTIYIKEGITEIGDYISSMPYKTKGVVVNGVTYTAYSKNELPHTCSYEWTNDSTHHWQICEGCDYEGEKTAHDYDNTCDTTCNTCGYVRTITHSYKITWDKDENQHWHECSVCGASDDRKPHNPGAAATENTAQTCTTCGYVIKAALGHTHDFGTDWKSNANKHWHECRCGDRKDEGDHVYDNSCDTTCNTCGNVRTITHSFGTAWESDDNQHWHVCTVCGTPDTKSAHDYDNDSDADCNSCGYTRSVETLPTQTESSSTVDTDPTETTDPVTDSDTTPETTSGSGDKGGNGSDNTIIIVVIIGIVVLILGVVIGIVIGKIKKK